MHASLINRYVIFLKSELISFKKIKNKLNTLKSLIDHVMQAVQIVESHWPVFFNGHLSLSKSLIQQELFILVAGSPDTLYSAVA